MGHDESAVVGSVVRKPQHRADCADFYCNPEDDASIEFNVPQDTRYALEDAAERAGRTWNEQMTYTLQVCQGDHRVSPDDERTATDWRTLMADATMCLDGDNWIPVRGMFPNMPKEVTH